MSGSVISRCRFVAASLGSTAAAFATPVLAQATALRLAQPGNNRDVVQKVGERFAADVAQRSNGRIKIDVYPGGSLGSELNLIQGIQTGIIDFAIHTSGYLESFVPTIQVLDLPFVFKDSATAVKVLDGDVGRQLAGDMLSKNIVLLSWGHYGWRQVGTASVPVNGPADLRGLKIRIQAGPISAATFKAVGATPVVMDVADFFVGLQQKTIEGLEIPTSSFVALKLPEIVKNLALTRHVYNAAALMASKPKFDAMPGADQAILRAAGAAQATWWRTTIAQSDLDNEKVARDQGVKITTPNFNAFRDAMTQVYAEFKPRFPELFDRVVAANR